MYKVENDLTSADEADLFKPVFKYYKAKRPKPSLEKVHDAGQFIGGNETHGAVAVDGDADPELISHLGLVPPAQWRAGRNPNNGLLVVENPFTAKGQTTEAIGIKVRIHFLLK